MGKQTILKFRLHAQMEMLCAVISPLLCLYFFLIWIFFLHLLVILDKGVLILLIFLNEPTLYFKDCSYFYFYLLVFY